MGFIEGVQAANQTQAQQNANSSERRQDKQQRLSNLIKGFEEDPMTGQYAPNQRGQTALDVQNQQLQQQLSIVSEQNAQIQSVLNKDSMTSGVTQMVKGDVAGGWKTMAQNPGLMKMLKGKGMEDLQPVNWMADKDLLEQVPALHGLTPEQLADPALMNALNSAYFKVKKNGKWQVNTTESLVKVTGTMQYLDRSAKVGMTNRLNKINEILTGKVQSPYDEKLKAQQTRNAIAAGEYEGMTTGLKIADMQKWMTDNPGGTLAEYMAHITPTAAADTVKAEKAQVDLKIAKEKLKTAQKENNPESFPRNEFYSIVDDSYAKYDGKGNVFSNEAWSLAKHQQDNLKVDATTKRDITARITLMDGFGKVKEGFENVDQNAWEKTKSVISKFVPNDWMNMTETEKTNMNKRLKEESRLGGYIADYIKMMSGAAVTDNERKTFTDIISSGKFATKDAFMSALEGFRESLDSSTNNMVEGTKALTPHTWMGFREMMAKKGFNKSYIGSTVGNVSGINIPDTASTENGGTPPSAESFMN